jgi:hypothetical protein
MTERQRFEAWWFNSDAFEYGQTETAYAAWLASRLDLIENIGKRLT